MILDINNLSVTYPGEETPAVAGVSLQLSEGKILCVVGESGSGKSSLALGILGLLPRTAATVTADSLRLCGAELAHATEAEWLAVRGRKVGFVFQDPLAGLNPVLRAGAQVEEALALYYPELPGRELRSRTLEKLSLVGVPDAARVYESFPHELSGGLRQRTLLAIALAGDPKLLIADEPTSSIDVTLQSQILELLVERKDRMSALVITHDLGVVAAIADEVAIMKDGRIVERGSADEIFYASRHPHTRALLDLRL